MVVFLLIPTEGLSSIIRLLQIHKREANFTFNTVGNHTIKLIVTDDGLTDSIEKTVTVIEEEKNQLPIATFKILSQQEQVPLTVTLDASSSYDPDGTIVSYDWLVNDTPLSLSTDTVDFTVGNANVDIIGGETVTRKTVTITFNTAGSYTQWFGQYYRKLSSNSPVVTKLFKIRSGFN